MTKYENTLWTLRGNLLGDVLVFSKKCADVVIFRFIANTDANALLVQLVP